MRDYMARSLTIECRGFKVEAELLDQERPNTCEAIWRALPFEGKAEVWKEEVYFEIPVKIPRENPTPRTRAGDVSYWPEGQGFCIFFGRSQPITPVNTFAQIKSRVDNFRHVRPGDRIIVRKV